MRVTGKVRYFCDKCNKEAKEHELLLSKIFGREGLIELCADCQKEFVKYVNNFFAKEEAKMKEEIQDDRPEVKVGDIIELGKYPQGENGEVEPIEWQVLDIKDGEALLVSKYVLDCKPFDKDGRTNDWEKCSLRGWLNVQFRRRAFSATTNKKLISEILLLSTEEAEKYFNCDDAFKCVPTAYAKARGVYTGGNYTAKCAPTCYWWLRSPGDFRSGAAYVYSDGLVNSDGNYVNLAVYGVRPAIWITL